VLLPYWGSNVAKRTTQRTVPRAQQHRAAAVVNLGAVRQRRKRELAERRVRAVIVDNRAALGRLFNSGLIFTQQGSRAGRDLLGAHQALLKIADLFAQLREERGHGAALELRAEEAFAHLDEQLEKSAELAARTGDFVGGRGRE
jgi:hypothetical protein